MERNEIRQLLDKENIPMCNISAHYVSDSIVENYIEKYKDWHIGDKVKLAISKENLVEEIKKDYFTNEGFELDWTFYKTLYEKELIIEDFYNVGAIYIKDFPFGMEIIWFEKI